MAVEAAEEVPYRAGTNIVADSVAFGLHVNAIKPKGVLVDHPINPVVAGAAKGATGVGNGTPETHAQKKIDDKAFKKLWRREADALKQILRKGSVYLPMRGSHCFVGGLRLIQQRFWRCLALIVRCLLRCSSPKSLKLLELAKKLVVDPGGLRRKDLLTPWRDPEIAAPRSFNQPCLAQIGLSPMHAIGEYCLCAGW